VNGNHIWTGSRWNYTIKGAHSTHFEFGVHHSTDKYATDIYDKKCESSKIQMKFEIKKYTAKTHNTYNQTTDK